MDESAGGAILPLHAVEAAVPKACEMAAPAAVKEPEERLQGAVNEDIAVRRQWQTN